ncbi:MAG: hypothetical protein VB853_15200 [Pirellulales bacterium]
MSARRVVLCCLGLCITAGGCASSYHRDQLALFAAFSGAAIGSAASNGNDNVAENAVVGGLAGALTGAVIGDHLDAAEARNQALIERQLGRRLSGSVTLKDVIALSQAGLSDQVITTHIAHHGLARPLTTQDLITLTQNGVNNAVIAAMQSPPVPPAPPRPVIVDEHFHNWHGPHHSIPLHLHGGPRRSRVHWGVSLGN